MLRLTYNSIYVLLGKICLFHGHSQGILKGSSDLSAPPLSLHAPRPNPINAVVKEVGYRAYELKDKLKSWSRTFFKKLAEFKPVSKEFTKVSASEDNIAQEFIHKPSGLKIFNVNDTNSDLTNIDLEIPLPETKEKVPGSAHFFEHMTMTNNIKELGKDIMTWAEENGVECNAYTSQREMGFNFNLPENKIKSIVGFLAKLFQKEAWKYDPKVVEGEREVIQGERQGRENTPSWDLWINRISKFFNGPNHFSSKNVLGTKEDIDKIGTKEFEEVRTAFNSGESILKINGPNSKLIDGIIHDKFQGISAKKEKTAKVAVDFDKDLSTETKQVYKHHDLGDGQTVVFYPDKEINENLKLSKKEKANILGTIWLATLIGDDSRLVKQFNDKKINHGMSFMGYSHENKGTVSLYTFFTDKKYFKQTLPMINNELNKIAKEGLSLEELKTIETMMENDLERTKESPTSAYRSAMSTALELEDDNWQQYTEKAQLDELKKVTSNQANYEKFNEQIKAFADTYFTSARQRTVETHFDKQSNIGNFSSENGKQDIKSENHYARPIAEFTGTHKLVRMPWDKVSVDSIDSKTQLVNDKESNISRVRIVNPCGTKDFIDPKILESGDDDLIRKETFRTNMLLSKSMSIFEQTLGASEELSPEKLDKRFKELGVTSFIGRGNKSMNFNLSGIKKNSLEGLKIFSEIMAAPAILSSDPEAVKRVEQKFNEGLERQIKAISESKEDRDAIFMREYNNELYKDDPERQSLEPDEKIAILKEIKLDDLREFFKERVYFDNNLKIIMNNSAQEAGLNSQKLENELLKINGNNIKKKKNPEYRIRKVLNIDKARSKSTNSKLDKTSALIRIGNLTEDLSKLSKEDRKLLSMAMRVLGEGGLNSKLGAKLRENGIYYWSMNSSLPNDDLGVITNPQTSFSVTCECKPEKVGEVKEAILSTIKEYMEEGPKQEEIERIQNRDNLEKCDSLKEVGSRFAFFNKVMKQAINPKKYLNLSNRFYDAKRAKELVKMIIKPDKFIESIDIPESAVKSMEKNNIESFSSNDIKELKDLKELKELAA